MNRIKPGMRGAMLAVVLSFCFTGMTVAQVGNNMGVLNPNRAGEEDLLALPHLDATLVKGIMDQRPFLSMMDLHAFLSQSLNEEQWTELYDTLFVPINLNTASEQEILLITGVGRRMRHEFEEYIRCGRSAEKKEAVACRA